MKFLFRKTLFASKVNCRHKVDMLLFCRFYGNASLLIGISSLTLKKQPFVHSPVVQLNNSIFPFRFVKKKV